jgi:hypothetical protein
MARRQSTPSLIGISPDIEPSRCFNLRICLLWQQDKIDLTEIFEDGFNLSDDIGAF